MQIYLITFFISFVLIYLSNKKSSIILEILGISVLSLLAALRSDTIGYDMKIYIRPVFDTFAIYGYNSNYVNNIGIEYLYLMFNYIVSLFTKNFSVYLFIMQFIILFFSYEGIKKIKDKNHTLMFIIFIFLYFNKSLNIARQSIALSFVIYSIKYIRIKDIKKFLITIIVASLIHKTSLITIVLYPIYWLLKSNNKKITIASIIVGCSVLIVFIQQILLFLINVNVLPERFMVYLTSYQKESIDFDMVELLVNLFILIVSILFSKRMKMNNDYSFYMVLLVIDTVATIIGGNINFISRIGLYFKIPAIVFLLSSFNTFIKEKNGSHIFANMFVVTFVLIYWIYLFGYRNIGDTVPFVFRR